MNWHRSSPSASGGNVLVFARPRRSASSAPPEHIRLASETSLRASDVYVRLLHDRLERARRARIGGGLGRLEASALHRVIAASDALQRACEDALAQIDRQLATRARLVAQAAGELVPDGSR
jgi:primosomal protein N''